MEALNDFAQRQGSNHDSKVSCKYSRRNWIVIFSNIRRSPEKSNASIVIQSQHINLQAKMKRESLKWGAINVALLSFITFDLSNKCPDAFSRWFYVEYAAAGVLLLSIIYYFGRYLYFLYTFSPIVGSEQQRKLLNFEESDTSFVLKPPKEKVQDVTSSPVNVSGLSWNSSFNDSTTALSSSWAYNRGSPLQGTFNCSRGPLNTSNSSPNTSANFVSPYKNTFAKDQMITDEQSLQSYLKETSLQEARALLEENAENSLANNSINSFWNNYKLDDYSALLKMSIYQLSPTAAAPKPGAVDEVGFFSGTDLNGSFEVGKKVSSAKLSHYVTNLKRWISCTILEPLVSQMDFIDKAFREMGFTDVQLGGVGLERLRKTAENQLVLMRVPSLPLVTPFLEVSPNQEYLVHRIRDLSRGTCIADYRWNAGAVLNTHKWDEHLPTDSAIIFHLFCTYLDSQLMPLPQPGGRPFSDRYVIVGDKKSQKETLAEVRNKSKCAILCTNPIKPFFNFISDDKIHESVHDRNNLFHVLTRFIIHMKTHHEGLLEGVNLGKSGINILCVVED
ncbi:transmembrane protein 209 [Phlebotomus argentipes]|uniref:transmembrane protein 209 n=1 Tax=Phlebotomus argentipes TaxID=94469 RepID=UPI0028936EE7|nr:transmembrane protein 209 [Phlebotomus argentipes]